MFPVEAFQSTVQKFTSIAHHCELRFHLTGGVTSVTWGEPRMTQDIDIVVDPVRLAEILPEFIQRLEESDFLFNENALTRGVAEGQQFQLLDEQQLLKLDLYPRELVPGELGRSRSVEIFAGYEIPIVSLVDAAVSKLFWIKGGSDKSRQDLQAILRRADAAEVAEIRELAANHGLTHVLDSVT